MAAFLVLVAWGSVATTAEARSRRLIEAMEALLGLRSELALSRNAAAERLLADPAIRAFVVTIEGGDPVILRLIGQAAHPDVTAATLLLGACDGPRIKANAAKHEAMRDGRMAQAEAALAEEVARWLAAAEIADAADDARFGADRRGDELPDRVVAKTERLARIRDAKAALAAAAASAGGGTDHPGPPPPATPPVEAPEVRARKAEAQRNFTDPDRRIMTTKDGFIQGDDAPAPVDGAPQIIVAHGLTDAGRDQAALTPLVDAMQTNSGRAPKEIAADAGHGSEASLAALEGRGVRGYIATGRHRHGRAAATGRARQQGPRVQAMRQRLRRGGFRSRHRWRKQTVAPVFAQIEQARGFRQSLSRGLAKVEHEWALVCTAHNLLEPTRALA